MDSGEAKSAFLPRARARTPVTRHICSSGWSFRGLAKNFPGRQLNDPHFRIKDPRLESPVDPQEAVCGSVVAVLFGFGQNVNFGGSDSQKFSVALQRSQYEPGISSTTVTALEIMVCLSLSLQAES